MSHSIQMAHIDIINVRVSTNPVDPPVDTAITTAIQEQPLNTLSATISSITPNSEHWLHALATLPSMWSSSDAESQIKIVANRGPAGFS